MAAGIYRSARNWLEYFDATDPHWELKMVAKNCLHKLISSSYELSSEVQLRCAVEGFDLAKLLSNGKLALLANRCSRIFDTAENYG